MRTFRSRTLAGAAVLSVALIGAACSDTDTDAGTDAGQVEAPEDTTTPTEDATAPTGDDAAAEGDISGRVGATYTANAFVLTGSDVADESGRILVVHPGDTQIRTAQTVQIAGEVVPFSDPQVAEVLGDSAEDLAMDWGQSDVVLAESVSVQE